MIGPDYEARDGLTERKLLNAQRYRLNGMKNRGADSPLEKRIVVTGPTVEPRRVPWQRLLRHS